MKHEFWFRKGRRILELNCKSWVFNPCIRLACLFIAGVSVSSCSSYDTRLTSSSVQYLGAEEIGISRGKASTLAEANSYWDGDGVPGLPWIQINLTEQKASFFKGNQLVGISAISSGKQGLETPTGHFKILEKSEEHFSSLYGNYVNPMTHQVVQKNVDVTKDKKPAGTVFVGDPMPYWMRVTNGVGLHAGFLPGVPDSHGCIRMPKSMARIFYAHVEKGTPVEIVR